jgi:hypothetical protein
MVFARTWRFDRLDGRGCVIVRFAGLSRSGAVLRVVCSFVSHQPFNSSKANCAMPLELLYEPGADLNWRSGKFTADYLLY